MTKPPQRLWLRGFLVALVALCALTLLLEALSLFRDSDVESAQLRRSVNLGVAMHNEESEGVANDLPKWAESDAQDEVPAADRLHLSLLHEACVTHKDAVIPWQFGSPVGGHQGPNATADNAFELMNRNDSNLLQKLRICPDVDIFLPVGLRGNGYCEDAVAYAKCRFCTKGFRVSSCC
jgi:hypothetical protein